jgi:hypothetical protein
LIEQRHLVGAVPSGSDSREKSRLVCRFLALMIQWCAMFPTLAASNFT